MPATSQGHSGFPQAVSGYDESLLASAPAATKEQIQSGYTTDLLRGKAKPPRRRAVPDLDGLADPNQQTIMTRIVPIPHRPFYRTRRGIIIVVLVSIVFLAVIIGTAVGVSRRQTTRASTTLPNSTSITLSSITLSSITLSSSTLSSSTLPSIRFSVTTPPPGAIPSPVGATPTIPSTPDQPAGTISCLVSRLC